MGLATWRVKSEGGLALRRWEWRQRQVWLAVRAASLAGGSCAGAVAAGEAVGILGLPRAVEGLEAGG